jgi:hypothetical protein
MEVMVAVQSGTLLRALRVQLKRSVSARRGGDYSEVPQAIQKKSHPSPSNCVTPSSCMLLSERGFGFQKAYVVECRVFASYFPSDEVQNEAEVRGSTPVSANDWGKNTAAVAVLIKFALNWRFDDSSRTFRSGHGSDGSGPNVQSGTLLRAL